MNLALLPLDAINAAGHPRADLGDLARLAESMRAVGLLQPVVVDEWGNLVAGRRRLAAAKLLGWSDIPALVMAFADDAAALAAFRDENIQRKPLTAAEVIEIGKRFHALEKPAPAGAMDEDDEPETCLICGKPARGYYPPDFEEAAPSCGSPRCELQMQAAQDAHDECGHR